MFAGLVDLGADRVGDIVRIADGVAGLIAMAFILWAGRLGARNHRAPRYALAAVWGFQSCVMILGGLGVIESAWVPWVVHGTLIVTSYLLIQTARTGVAHWGQLQKQMQPLLDQLDAQDEQ